jgi:peptidoglycan/xylan/chitin deacetylase (PgdA/CDA1 family)
VIEKVLAAEKVKASFFLTGNFYRNKAFKKIVQQLKDQGHYLGCHSDRHLALLRLGEERQFAGQSQAVSR